MGKELESGLRTVETYVKDARREVVIQPSGDGRGGAGLEGASACSRFCRGEHNIVSKHRDVKSIFS